ncbi:hypothetical protein [Methylophilus medardicus]|uniref:Uncharacterized protein n=1 Tax=Methylophilus medardicus TaxID=2588534 RepID=A0A5B8CPX3_9PROT|nr:hypothetical protein [Methylophilus medardicus]QDC43146.1 hypothetical protein FIU01_00485 [Methylophilus medardicus]QDC48153.1 hypothetical protein FIU00_00485 [Methylophilus medardicus]QDC51858.1 hypothetical protein FIT99_00485 [Methylophilus medardicus]
MKLSRVWWGLALLLLVYAGFWYWQSLTTVEPERAQSVVAQTINQCDLIASKAASALPEVLPFQKLEKAARQARVLERCMQDRGYQENPAWVAEATKQAQKMAGEQAISEAEAYETLRRQGMLAMAPTAISYWRKSK